MIIKMDAYVVGRGQKISGKTGNVYDVVTFMDGADPISIMVKNGVDLSFVEPMNKYCLTLDVNLGRYMKATITKVEVCQ